MMRIVLVAPEIPQNTGNIGRLCVNTGSRLHLVKPLAFSLADKHVKRAGLDYWPHLDLRVHESWEAFLNDERPGRMVFASTRGTRSIYTVDFRDHDYLVFGNETGGLPGEVYTQYADSMYRIPMTGAAARSLNLANAVAVVLFEALRQVHGWDVRTPSLHNGS